MKPELNENARDARKRGVLVPADVPDQALYTRKLYYLELPDSVWMWLNYCPLSFPASLFDLAFKTRSNQMSSHLIDGEFQSDKYPTTPRGKVPLSVKDPSAQDLLWQYAARHEKVDKEFSEDLRAALVAAGYEPKELLNAYGLALYTVIESESPDDDKLTHWFAARNAKEARELWEKMVEGMYTSIEFGARQRRLDVRPHNAPLPDRCTVQLDDGRGSVPVWSEFMATHEPGLIASWEW